MAIGSESAINHQKTIRYQQSFMRSPTISWVTSIGISNEIELNWNQNAVHTSLQVYWASTIGNQGSILPIGIQKTHKKL